MNIEQANAIPLPEILKKMGQKPVKEEQGILYYASFIHVEPRRFSLAVNTHTNTWQDIDIAGRPLDLVCLYLKSCKVGHSVNHALRWLDNMFGYYLPPLPAVLADHSLEDAQYSFDKETYLSNGVLLEYIEQRGIPFDIARFLLKEVVVFHSSHKRKFHFIGLRNEDGGFYIRSPQAKANIGDKAITFIRGTDAKPPTVNVFADIWDYLSLITQQKGRKFKNDSIILNSGQCLKDATAYIRNYGYDTLQTWMDNSPQGDAMTLFWSRFAKLEPGLKHLPMNSIYRDFRSVNEWHLSKRK